MPLDGAFDANQDARIAQARELVYTRKAEAWPDIQAMFRVVHFDIDNALSELGPLAEAAWTLRTTRNSQQGDVYEAADDHTSAIELGSRWHGRLALGLKRLKSADPDAYASVDRRFPPPDGAAGWDIVAAIAQHMTTMERFGLDPIALGLPPSFLIEGAAIVANADEATGDRTGATVDRQTSTAALHAALHRVGELIDLISVAVEQVKLETGSTPPGFEFATLSAAVADRRPAAAAPGLPPLAPEGEDPA